MFFKKISFYLKFLFLFYEILFIFLSDSSFPLFTQFLHNYKNYALFFSSFAEFFNPVLCNFINLFVFRSFFYFIQILHYFAIFALFYAILWFFLHFSAVFWILKNWKKIFWTLFYSVFYFIFTMFFNKFCTLFSCNYLFLI